MFSCLLYMIIIIYLVKFRKVFVFFCLYSLSVYITTVYMVNKASYVVGLGRAAV